MNVLWTVPAADQLEQVYDYIAQTNPNAAEETTQHIIDTTEMLGGHPAAGRRGRVPGTREFIVPGTRFVVVYAVRKETLLILAVYHGARKWPERL